MNPSLKKFEAVATVVELRHLAADQKRLEQLKSNRLVLEHAELIVSVPAALTDLEEKRVAYEEAQEAKRKLAAEAAKEGDAMVADEKPPASKATPKKKAAKKKAAKKTATRKSATGSNR